MEKNIRNISIHYALVQALYWAEYCVTGGFAGVYLLSMGYSNTQLGLILGVGNIMSLLLSTSLATLIDRYEQVSVHKILMLLVSPAELISLIILLLSGKGAFTSVFFVVHLAFCVTCNSLITKLQVDIVHKGLSFDFSRPRSMGSLAYVLASYIMGFVVEKSGNPRLLIISAIVLVVLQCCMLISIERTVSRCASAVPAVREELPGSTALLPFLRKNGRFCLLLIGTAMIYTSHNGINAFLVNMTANVGGTTSTFGFINGYIAMVEIPGMFIYSILKKKQGPVPALSFAVVFFTLKAFTMAAAGSVLSLTLASTLQMVSFAFFVPASVDYINSVIPYQDSAKGQTLCVVMTTLGSVAATFSGGVLQDSFGIRTTMLIFAAVSAAGTVCALQGIEKRRKTNAA